MRSAGDFDRLIRLQRSTYVEGPVNDSSTWSTLADVSARRQDVSDGEKFAADQMRGNLLTRWLIRWRPDLADLDGADRLEYPVDSGKFWGILGVKEVGRQEEIEITAQAPQKARA